MRTRLFFFFLAAASLFFANEAKAADIAYGVQTVVIDAGHGGRYPGAHYGNTYEKEITLKVALKLGKLIETEMPGVKVVYTRTTDKTLGADLAADLQARADIANKAKGDLFISIHVNAARNTQAQGVETLVMGESTKEQDFNEGALYENNREDLIDMSDARTAAIVRAYIQNLQFTYGTYSMAMARCIQNNYEKAGRHARGVKPQLLRVLYATDMPGVLTEIGFMSNPAERAFLTSDAGQTKIARALLGAVENYSDYVLKIRASAAGTPPPAASLEEEQPDTLGASTPAPESEAAAPAPVVVPAETEAAPTIWSIQVLSAAKSVAVSDAQFKTYRNKVKQYCTGGRLPYKYCTGEYKTRAAAAEHLAAVRKVFPDAFVVCCQGTEIVK